MTIDRRHFAYLTAGAAVSRLTGAARGVESLVYFGTYTGPKSKGIYVCRFHSGTGKAGPVELAGETPSPSFVTVDPSGRFLYAANEISNFGGQRSGSVSAFSIDRSSGKLTALNTQSSKGSGPCYVSTDSPGKNVLVANYGGGSVAVLPVSADGKLSEASAFIQYQGSSANPKRQREPHAHCIKLSPDGRFVLVSDLGTDKVMVYRFDGGKGTLTANDPDSFKAKPGAGPRHFAFHPNGRTVYIINELDSTVTAARWEGQKGALTAFQTASTVPDGFTGENSTAEVVVHPTGKLLFGSNRGHNSIATFALDGKGGMTPKGHTSTNGEIPRNFALDPSGQFLLAANQKTDNIVVFRVDRSGKLTPTGDALQVGSPVCVRFLPLA